MSWRESQLSLLLMSEEKAGAPMRRRQAGDMAAEDMALEATRRALGG